MSPAVLTYLLVYMCGFLFILHFSEWFTVWVGLEIIMYGFLILSFSGCSVEVEESCYKYFFTQSLGSGLLLGMLYMGGFDLMMELILLYKLGVGPFYFWYLTVMRGLDWGGCFMLMGMQKLAPLLLLRELDLLFNWIVVMMSLLLGVLGSVGQLYIKDLLAFSSLHYMGWIMMLVMCDGEVWFYYFIMYMMMMSGVMYTFNSMNILNLGELENFVRMDIIMNMIIMGGIPPMTGFILKWFGIMYLINVDLIMLVMLIVTSVMMCYLYMRLIIHMILSCKFCMLNVSYYSKSIIITNINMGFMFIMMIGALL